MSENFLSSADLKIPDRLRDAFIKTLALLESGKMRHVSTDGLKHAWIPPDARKFSSEFNMNNWSYPHDCGTVCCIGGTVELIGRFVIGTVHPLYESDPALHELFYPRTTAIDYEFITPAQAGAALRSYLATGNPSWPDCVSAWDE
jgi:hypothetical protein